MNIPALRGSRIIGFGHHQPSRILTNDELSTMVDTNDEWITTRTGIKTRHIAGPDDTVTSMAVEAGRAALADSGVDPAEVGLVVVASTTHQDRAPYTAGRVAAELGLSGRAAPIDINTACSGFEYAMGIADQAVRTGSADTALVIGSEELLGDRRLGGPFDLRARRRRCRRSSGRRLRRTTDRAGVVGERAAPAAGRPRVR
ncbi:beta-ketoacyl synthase N-terminal-like domain-containing protein [Curtobacterium sp. 1P10AnD]|uniref:thiolase family protein n=1 Tax=Curtobacterium sp. 1P10AnD TaxID=3132283 RepID=UPI0039A31E1D